jgi:hypothetical protein
LDVATREAIQGQDARDVNSSDGKGSRRRRIRRTAVKIKSNPPLFGAIAQLGERIVRNDEVVGSIPTSSTKLLNELATLSAISVTFKDCSLLDVGDRESSAASLA